MWEKNLECLSTGNEWKFLVNSVVGWSSGGKEQIAILKSKWITVINVDKVEMTGFFRADDGKDGGRKELLIEFNASCAIWPKLLRKFTSLTAIFICSWILNDYLFDCLASVSLSRKKFYEDWLTIFFSTAIFTKHLRKNWKLYVYFSEINIFNIIKEKVSKSSHNFSQKCALNQL